MKLDGKDKIKCYDHRPGKCCHTENCPLTQILNGTKEYTHEISKEKNEKVNHFIVTAKPLLDEKGPILGIVEFFQDITDRKKIESEKEILISRLRESIGKVKLLSGFIPICASCKQIRDDKGYWSQIESYIRDHSEAEFSHSICPECAKKLYPDFNQKE